MKPKDGRSAGFFNMDLSRSAVSSLEAICSVIAEVAPGRSADAALRETFRNGGHGMGRAGAREISEQVFAYFKWKGWLTPGDLGIAESVRATWELERRFRLDPGSFSEAELNERAAPAWAMESVPSSPGWCRALQQRPRLWLRNGGKKGTPWGIEGVREHPVLDGAGEYLGIDDLFRSVEFHEGRFEIQDLSSQAVGWICGPRAGEHWWDVCAGEGGKTLHCSALMENRGLIWATDRSKRRLEQLRRRAARAGCHNYRAELWDGKSEGILRRRFHGVLVDAPCSGLGTWGRNPDARWTTTRDDVNELASVQYRLLSLAARCLRPGGRLVYSVCTLTFAETNGVCDAMDAFGKELGIRPKAAANPLDPQGAAQARHWIWPQTSGGNGMFVAIWERDGAR